MPLQECDVESETALGEENIAMFLPTDDFKAATGSYRHLRAAAAVICKAGLRNPLPEEWQDIHEYDLTDENGKPWRRIPKVLRQNMSFTNVIFRDPHVDAKVFTLQHRWGTGSFASTLDCVQSRSTCLPCFDHF